ncbi:uncharacterized protein LOC143032148 [Oratosquilla oratoria]|uniref:uncharacterized protein LOC143032148 n=1 Tax=Oratosquilla oratoria TaxID=337810 RepID=UPI003F75E82F
MQLLAFLAFLVAAAWAAPRSSEYAFVIHEEGNPDNVERSQFHVSEDDGSYKWGYEFPGRIHLESSDSEGKVLGTYGYIDANGVLVINSYKSDTENGYEVVPNGAEQVARDSKIAAFRDIVVGRLNRESFVEPVNEQQPAEQAEESVEPTIYLAQRRDEGVVKIAQLIGESQEFPNQAKFRVAQDVVDSAKGVSDLASKLNAHPVAARHDVQSRTFGSDRSNSDRPVMVHHQYDDNLPLAYYLYYPVGAAA